MHPATLWKWRPLLFHEHFTIQAFFCHYEGKKCGTNTCLHSCAYFFPTSSHDVLCSRQSKELLQRRPTKTFMSNNRSWMIILGNEMNVELQKLHRWKLVHSARPTRTKLTGPESQTCLNFTAATPMPPLCWCVIRKHYFLHWSRWSEWEWVKL